MKEEENTNGVVRNSTSTAHSNQFDICTAKNLYEGMRIYVWRLFAKILACMRTRLFILSRSRRK